MQKIPSTFNKNTATIINRKTNGKQNMHKISIGDIELTSNVILAPMAGITDYPFRKIVRRFGNFLMYSEMIASYAAIRNAKKLII